LAFTGSSGPGVVYGLDARSGVERLTFKARHFVSTGPAVVDGVVYFGTGHGTIVTRAGELFGLDVATKKVVLTAAGGAFVGNPVPDGTDLVVASEDEAVTRVNRADGATVWKLRTKKFHAGSPAVADDLVLVGSFDHRLYAVDRLTGELAWHYETTGPLRGTPTVAQDTVYVGSYDGCVYALTLSTGKRRWTYAASSFVLSTAAVHDGAVFVGCNDGSVHAVDAETGIPKWVWPGDDPQQRGVIAQPLVHDGKVLVASRTGAIYALDLDSGVPLGQQREGRRAAVDSAAADDDLHLTERRIGTIHLPTGMIVVCDPVTDLHDRPLDRKVKAGDHPVIAGIVRMNGDERVAWLEIRLSDDPVVSWESAADAFVVDSGTAALLSVESATCLVTSPDSEEEFGERVEDQMNASYGSGQRWAGIDVLGRKNIDVIVTESGYGDGQYQCDWGMNRGGRPVRLRLDFGISERGAS
jgi:outer membrane protein assembly factor BamB